MSSKRVQQARDVVETARAKAAEIEAQQAAAELELASIEQRSGQEFLDDLSSAEQLAATMQQLRDRINILGRALEVQRPRVAAAESAYLHAEADELEKPVAAARSRLVTHQAHTDELLAQLERHEGRFVPEVDLIHERRSNPQVIRGEQRSWTVPKSHQLHRDLEQAEARVQVVRELAEGRDPQDWLRPRLSIADGSVAGVQPRDLYPPFVWGPDAVVPAPAYVRALASTTEVDASVNV